MIHPKQLPYSAHIVRIEALPTQSDILRKQGWTLEPTSSGDLLFRRELLIPDIYAQNPNTTWHKLRQKPRILSLDIRKATSWPPTFRSAEFEEVDLEHPSWMHSMCRMWMCSEIYNLVTARIHVKVAGRRSNLCVYTRLSGSLFDNYLEFLSDLRKAHPDTPCVGFSVLAFSSNRYPTSPNLWWDVANDVIFTFDNPFAKLLRPLITTFTESEFGELKTGNPA